MRYLFLRNWRQDRRGVDGEDCEGHERDTPGAIVTVVQGAGRFVLTDSGMDTIAEEKGLAWAWIQVRKSSGLQA